MNHRYEALLVLNTQGKEDTVKEITDRLESEFQKEGAQSSRCKKWINATSPTSPARSMPDIM
jgi:hypothetical protein